ncbi:hypothetical protein KR038_002305 [Drosophila bunnanda]|nr:hypothetical protein KR038_002305 [Drosophila bunnanda]
MDFNERTYKKPKLDKYTKKLDNRTKNWGKVKFKPQVSRSNKTAFTPPDPQATAKPWQHVKNDIIDDSEELSHASRLDVDSEGAKQFMQQREQNHRRNIIETNRSVPTKWESFDDEQQKPSTSAKGNKKEKSRLWQCDKSKGEFPTDVKNFSFRERDFFRRKITLGLKSGAANLVSAINDLKRNNGQLQPTVKNSFKAKNSNPAQKRGGNPFNKSQRPLQKKGKGKKSGEE